jgi:hypothetical protein
MPDEIDSDLLDDLGISDVVGDVTDLGAVADSADSADDDDGDDDIGAADDLGSTSPAVVYDDVQNDELFIVDAQTGDTEVVNPADVSDSAEIELVDDEPDDAAGFAEDDGMDDPGFTGGGDDPSIGDAADAEFEDV